MHIKYIILQKNTISKCILFDVIEWSGSVAIAANCSKTEKGGTTREKENVINMNSGLTHP